MKLSWIFLLLVVFTVVWIEAVPAKSSSHANGKQLEDQQSTKAATTTTTTKKPSHDYDDDSNDDDKDDDDDEDSDEDDKNKKKKKQNQEAPTNENSSNNGPSSSTSTTTTSTTTQKSTSTVSTESTTKPKSSPTTKAPSEADAIEELNVDPQSSDKSLDDFEKDLKKQIKDKKNEALRNIAKRLKDAGEDQKQQRITKSQYSVQKRQLKKAKKRVIKKAKSKQRELDDNVKARAKQLSDEREEHDRENARNFKNARG